MREREVDDGDDGVTEEVSYKWAVGGGGYDGDGGLAVEEEVGRVEEGDGVAFCQERENKYVWLVGMLSALLHFPLNYLCMCFVCSWEFWWDHHFIYR